MAAALRSLPPLVSEVRGLADLLGITAAAEQTAEEVAVAVRAAVVAQQEQVELLQSEVVELPLVRAQLAAALQEVGGLKDRLLTNADTLRGAEHARAERDVAIAALRTELEQARATIGRLEGELRAAESAHELIPRLQVLVEQSNERVVALEAELANRSSAIFEREVAIGRLRGTAEALQEQVARITSERDSLRETVKAGS
jgi:chromosome segregation ATPase